MNTHHWIYGLTDPLTHQIRYVGKTRMNPSKRYTAHVTSNTNKTPCSKWIKSLREQGLRPAMVILQHGLDWRTYREAEIWWVQYLRFLGADLTNVDYMRNGGVTC